MFIFNPQLIVVKASGWNAIAVISFAVSTLVLIKDAL